MRDEQSATSQPYQVLCWNCRTATRSDSDHCQNCGVAIEEFESPILHGLTRKPLSEPKGGDATCTLRESVNSIESIATSNPAPGVSEPGAAQPCCAATKALEEILALRLNPYCMTPSPELEVERAYSAGIVNSIARKALATPCEVARLEAEIAKLRAIANHAVGCMDRGCRICNQAMAEAKR